MFRSRQREITISRVNERTVHCLRLCAELRRLLQIAQHQQPESQTQARIIEEAVWQHYDTLRHRLTRLARQPGNIATPMIRDRLARLRMDM